MRGRTQLVTKERHPLNILISEDEYQTLRKEAAAVAMVRPGYSVGDLVRRYIERGLGRRASGSVDPKSARIRLLHGIARSALQVARELKERT